MEKLKACLRGRDIAEQRTSRLGDDAGEVVADLRVVLLIDELSGGLLARDGAGEVVPDLRVMLLIDGVDRNRTVLT